MQDSIQIIKEYRVGKMTWDGKLVKARIDRGRLQLIKELNRNIYRIRWYNVDKQTSEDDLVLEDGFGFEAIKESKNNNSVFVLKKHLKPLNIYWIQDRGLVLDELLKELNLQMKQMLDDASVTNADGGGESGSSNDKSDLNSAIQSIVEQVKSKKRRISLSDILTGEIVNEIKQDQSLIEELKEQMPPNQRSLQDINTALNCPQVKYTIRLLDESIYSEQIVTLSAAMGLDISFDSLIDKNPMEVFISALENKYNEKEK